MDSLPIIPLPPSEIPTLRLQEMMRRVYPTPLGSGAMIELVCMSGDLLLESFALSVAQHAQYRISEGA
jgi:hypothetical protein